MHAYTKTVLQDEQHVRHTNNNQSFTLLILKNEEKVCCANDEITDHGLYVAINRDLHYSIDHNCGLHHGVHSIVDSMDHRAYTGATR